MMIFNTRRELHDFLNNNWDSNGCSIHSSLVNIAAFGLDLLEEARANDNEISIYHPTYNEYDDGGFIQIDDMGYVVADFAIC